MSRRVGISKNGPYKPLLNFVRGRERTKLEQDVEDDALPLSSGDEEDEDPEITPEKPTRAKGLIKEPIDESSDESEPETRTRGDIRPTTFGSSNKPLRKPSQGATKRIKDEDFATEEPNKGRNKSNKRKRGDADDGLPRPTRKIPSQTTPASSAHLKDKQGFTRRPKLKQTFGSQKGTNSQSSQSQSKKNNAKKPALLKAPDPLSSPEKSPKKGRLVAPRSSIPSSPEKGPTRRFVKGSQGDGSRSSSPEDKLTLKLLPSESQGSQRSQGSRNSGEKYQSKHLANWQKQHPVKETEKEKKTKVTRESSPPRARAKFMMPANLSDGEDNKLRSGDGDAYSLPSDIEDFSDSALESEPEDPTNTADSGGATTCPWCGEAVEAAILRDFSQGRLLNVNMRRKFCQKHKEETAKDIWRSRHYPTIEWDRIEDRFDEHRQFLLGIIRGEPSHFRRILADSIESGKAARTLQKEGNLNPGYYGTRGFNLMCDYLSSPDFNDVLKENAVGDRTISGRGLPAFVQGVLVAELAVRLIQDDMEVSSREAREIMEESKAVGELIHGQH